MIIIDSIISIFAFAVTLPLLSFFFLFLLLIVMTNSKKRALLLAADIGVVLFIFSIYFKLLTLSQKAFYGGLFFVCLLILFTGLLILIRSQSSISLSVAFKKCWRFSFLLLLPLSTFLTVYGIISGILEYL
ncbi:DUF3397 family protein [Metabacillus idriensis]|uniref:DUF3397 family protein n=1 Tax=Metabacillus idriensis TaxID=324768 RepID=A0A6I2M5T6_9BACI|nr:DUF3397 family protein [Metabacillus idriensis]MCM3594415.1 DUF3397 family protein [Metabacillus idriensis]MRX53555.1 DUF3397 family protein [Metabacillus idriensis]OHR72900.1 hypothetical protein HMPREF3291_21180 [Bacillus sp. HMSC76G11]